MVFVDAEDQVLYSKKLLEEIRVGYFSIGRVYCPCLDVEITFNAQGFHHFKYHGGGEARHTTGIIHKLKLFPLVIPVIKRARTVTDYEKTVEPKNRKNKAPQKEVEYWSIVAEVGRNHDVKVKVVLKRVGAGNIIFWSVMKLKK